MADIGKRLACVGLVAVLAMGACGGDDDTASATTSTTEPAVTSVPASVTTSSTSSTIEGSTSTTVALAPLTVQQLRNAPVPALCDHDAGVLVDGEHSTNEFGGVYAQPDADLIADLDGDGEEEALVYVGCNAGGNVQFFTVLAYGRGPVLLDEARPADAELLMKAPVLRSDVIEIDRYGYDIFDARCCPSRFLRSHWRLVDDRLIETVGSTSLGTAVGIGSVGPLRTGMDLFEASGAIGDVLDVDTLEDVYNDSAECFFGTFETRDDVGVLGSESRIRMFYAAGEGFHTDGGVGVGSTPEEVRAAHPEVEEFDNIYNDHPDLILYDGDRSAGIRFVFFDVGEVGTMYTGETGWIELPEGCA